MLQSSSVSLFAASLSIPLVANWNQSRYKDEKRYKEIGNQFSGIHTLDCRYFKEKVLSSSSRRKICSFCGLSNVPFPFRRLQNDMISKSLKRKRTWERKLEVISHLSSHGRNIVHLSISRWRKGITLIWCFVLIAFHRMKIFCDTIKSFVCGRRKEISYICWSALLFCAAYSCAESYTRKILQTNCLPAVTSEISDYLGRRLDHGIVKRVSPLSVVLESASIGPHPEEFSCGEFASVKLRLRPWDSLMRLHPVVDAVVERPHILIAQKEDWTWFGIPTPSEKPFERHRSSEDGIDHRTKCRRLAREQASLHWIEERHNAAIKAAKMGYHSGTKYEQPSSMLSEELENVTCITEIREDGQLINKCMHAMCKGNWMDGSKVNQSLDCKFQNSAIDLKNSIVDWKNWLKENIVKSLHFCFETSNKKRALMYEKAVVRRRILDRSAVAAKNYFDRDTLKRNSPESKGGSNDNSALVSATLNFIEGEENSKNVFVLEKGDEHTNEYSAKNAKSLYYLPTACSGEEFSTAANSDFMRDSPCVDNQCREPVDFHSMVFQDTNVFDRGISSIHRSIFEGPSSQHLSDISTNCENIIEHETFVESMPKLQPENEVGQTCIYEQSRADKPLDQDSVTLVDGGLSNTRLREADDFEKTIRHMDECESSVKVQNNKPVSIRMPERKTKKNQNQLNFKVPSALASIKNQPFIQTDLGASDDSVPGFPIFRSLLSTVLHELARYMELWKEKAKRLTDQAKIVDLHSVDFKNGTLMLLAYGDDEARVMENVNGHMIFKSTYDSFHLRLTGRPKQWRTGMPDKDGGELDINATVDIPQQNWSVNLKGKDLFASLFERLLDIPILWFTGTASGEVYIYMSKDDNFPNFYGELDVKDLDFQVVDAPSSFSKLNGSLCFRGQQIFLHSASGNFGEVPLEVSGGFGINPEDGEYHLICKVPDVEINSLMRSLDAKPFMFPLAGSLKAIFNCQGPLDVPVFVGTAAALKKNNPNLNMPSSVAAQTLLENKDAGAAAAVDCIPFSFVSGNFTFNTDNHVADLYGIRAMLLDGGEIRGAGNAWICPEGEIDDNAVDFAFSGSIDFDELVHRYLPAGIQSVPVKLYTVNGDAKVNGSLLRPRLDIKWRAPKADGSFADFRGDVLISDEAVTFNSSSITFELSTKVQVKNLTEIYKRKHGSEMLWVAPELEGIETDLRLRGFDIFGLTPFSIIGSPKPMHLKLTGRIKFQGCVLPSSDAEKNIPVNQEENCNNDGLNKMKSSSLSGEILLSGMKLNQLFIVPQLSGSFHVTPQSFKLETMGRPDENLLIEYVAGAKSAPFERQSNESVKRKAYFSLQKGRLRTRASFQPGHSGSLEVHQLQLDELEVASLRGLVQKAEVQLNFLKRKGQGSVSVMRPRFSGLQGESLDVSARWSGDVITLEKSVLEQSFSKYELQGEYVLPGTRDFLGDRDRRSMLKTAMAGELGALISSMGRWRLRLEVPHAEVAEMLPLARLLSRSSDPAVLSRSKEMFLLGVQNIGFFAENLKKQLETAHWIKSSHIDEGVPEAIPLPGLAELRGRWNGSLQASGGGNGDTIAEFDLHGEEWEWGSYTTQKVIAVGCFSNNDGLRLEKIFIQRDKETLHADGTLSEKASNLHFAVLNFPVELVPRLLQALKSSSMEPLPSSWTPPPPLKGILHMEGDLRGNLAKPECDVQVRLLDGAVGGVDLKRAEVVAFIKSSNRFLFNANFEPTIHSGHVHVCGNLPVNPLRTDTAEEDDKNGEERGSAMVREWKLDVAECIGKDDHTGKKFARDKGDEVGEVSLTESLKVLDWNLSDSSAFKVKATVKDGGMMLITAVSPYIRWLQGNADIVLDVGGKIDEPVFDGSAVFHRASVSSPVLPTPLSNFGGTITINKNQLQINSIEGRVGRKGRLLVEGKLPLRKDVRSSIDKIEMKSESLEVRAKNVYNGQVDSQIQVAGSILEPEVSGTIKLSHGEAFLPQEKGSGAALSHLASSPRSILSSGYSRFMAAGNTARSYITQSLQMDPTVKVSAVQESTEKTMNGSKSKPMISVYMQALKVQLGPELRLIYPLILNFAVSGELELSGPADPKFIKPKGTLTFENGDVNLVATQVRLRRDHPNRAKFEPDQGLDPTLDLVLVGADWQLKIQGHASNWQDNLVVTSTRSGEQDVLSPNEAARVFETQLATSILEGDGQLAFEKLAAATLETIMPRIEGKGKLGHARWRLVSAPQIPNLSLDPHADPLKSISNISFGAEVEVQLGKRLQASVARQLKETEMATHWTLQYQLSSRLRVLFQSIPSGDQRLLFEYSATSQE